MALTTVGIPLSKGSTVTHNADAEKVEEFYRWFEEERTRRGLSYEDISHYRGVYKRMNYSSIWKASKYRSDPTERLMDHIAQAFGMDINEVREKAGKAGRVPKEFVSGTRPELSDLLRMARELSDDELKLINVQLDYLLRQKRQQIQGRGKKGN